MNKLSKKWKISIMAIAVLLGSLYGIYKANNRNAFEEMFNSYYNFVPISALYNMPQIEPIPRDNIGADVVVLNYKENNNEREIDITLVGDDNESISIFYSVLISDGVHLAINYSYDINSHKLRNYVSFYGDNVPKTKDEKKQIEELLKQYNISKEQLQKISDEGLDRVLTDWKRYSNSPYSRDNMGRLTIEKDEFLR
ncbi:TipC family immunity protein [Gemella sanguinis]|uniref:TipC family immunity protein n=2 Tax=Gemella sanguinis TaxID=84135 RepID=UPI0004E1E01B|nr:TipC family immunity protein [Gemella sanguinis]NKZ26503.1 TipC family immunity protein [Gemella sanguinis]